MPARPLKYRAFISYRRKDAGTQARWLRRRLLNFRLPKEVLDDLPEDRRVDAERRVAYFLDTSYQSANEDFWSSNIEPALKDSEYLIVLSSPSALETRPDGSENWVAREIASFLAVHGEAEGRKRIIVALTPKASTEVFPGSLNQLSGNWDWADLRDNPGWRLFAPRIAKRLDDAFLKIAARLFEIPQQLLPVLYREEARQRVKQRVIAAAAACATLAIAGGSIAVAGYQHRESLRQESAELANKSRRQAANGDLAGALQSALLARDRSDIPDAKEALLQAVLATDSASANAQAVPAAALVGRTGANYSPDGRYLAVITADPLAVAAAGSLAIWDLPAGRETQRFPLPQPCANPAPAFSGDSSVIAVACTGGALWAWRPPAQEPVLKGDGCAGSASISLDRRGQRLALACEGGAAEVLDLGSGRKLAHVDPLGNELLKPPDSGFLKVAISPDGRRALVWADGRAVLWDVDRNQPLRTITDEPLNSVVSAAFSRESKLLAIGTFDSRTQVWSAESGELLHEFVQGKLPVFHVAFNAAGTHLLTGELAFALPVSGPKRSVARELKTLAALPVPAQLSENDDVLLYLNDHVRIFDVGNGSKPLMDLETAVAPTVRDGKTGEVKSELPAILGGRTFLSADGKFAYSITDAGLAEPVQRWSLGGASISQRLRTPEHPTGAFLSADGKRVLVLASSGGPPRPGEPIIVRAYGPVEAEKASEQTPAAGIVLARSDRYALVARGTETALVDLHSLSDRTVWRVADAADGTFDTRGTCAFVHSASGQGQILVSESRSAVGVPRAPLAANVKFVGPDCRFVAADFGRGVRLWTVVDGRSQPPRDILAAQQPQLLEAGDGVIALALKNGDIVLLDANGMPKGEPLHAPDGSRVTQSHLFAARNRLLAVYGNGELVIWDTSSGKSIGRTKFIAGNWLLFESGPDDATVAIYGARNQPQVWNVDTGRIVTTEQGSLQEVTSLAFNPDGSRVASVEFPSFVRVWDARDGHTVAQIRADATDVGWSPDGRKLLVTLSLEHTLKMFDFPEGQELVDLARKLAASMPASPDSQKPR